MKTHYLSQLNIKTDFDNNLRNKENLTKLFRDVYYKLYDLKFDFEKYNINIFDRDKILSEKQQILDELRAYMWDYSNPTFEIMDEIFSTLHNWADENIKINFVKKYKLKICDITM